MFMRGKYDEGSLKEGRVWLRFLTGDGPIYVLVDPYDMVAVTVYSHRMWRDSNKHNEFGEISWKPRLRRQNHRQKGVRHG